MEKENIVELKNISVAFDGEQVLDGLNLTIKDKEFITLLGPSGCGKTTTLRLIAGFLEPDSGDVLFEGEKINGVPAYKRQVNTIFQRYALFPHLNVYENIAFGLRVKKRPEKEIKENGFFTRLNRFEHVISFLSVLLKTAEKKGEGCPSTIGAGGQLSQTFVCQRFFRGLIVLLVGLLSILSNLLRLDFAVQHAHGA